MGGVSAAGPMSSRAVLALSTREALLDAALAVFTEHTSPAPQSPWWPSGRASRSAPSTGTIRASRRWATRCTNDGRADCSSGWPARPDESTSRQAFGHLRAATRDFAAAHPAAFAFLEYQQHSGYLDADSVALAERSAQALRGGGARAGARGDPRGDPTVLVALAYGAFIGLAKAQWTGAADGAADMADAERAVWDLLPHPSHRWALTSRAWIRGP